jgi:molybdopterin molybdotransferase
MLQVLSLEEAGLLLNKKSKKREFLTKRVPLAIAQGCVLTESVSADSDLPAFPRSAVDGFAVCAGDTFGASVAIPALLRLAGEVHMGERAAFSIQPGECAVVWTGGELPSGADAMVMLEEAQTLSPGMIAVETASVPGRHVVFRGDDVRQGDELLSAGRRLGAREIGLLCALGVAEVSVYATPRVHILSTGDELIDPAETPIGGQIRDINSAMLSAACAEAGAEARFFGRVPDDETALMEAMQAALADCDLLLLSGGSSAGAKDAAARCLGKLGRVFFHGLALKPGKPTLAGEIEGTLVVCLPGHPAAAYLVFLALVRPLLASLAGEELREQTVLSQLTQAIPSNDGREELILVRLTDDGAAEPVAAKSGLVLPLTRADGYVVIPRDAEGLPKGAQVRVILF